MKTQSIQIIEIYDQLRKISRTQGLHFFGATTLDVSSDFMRYKKWLSEGRHGDMSYLEKKNLELRHHPAGLLPGAQTAWVFGFPYFLGDKWRPGVGHDKPWIAQYGRLPDYHKFLRKKLERIIADLKALQIVSSSESWRITVDSAPLLERAIAANTEGGFIGKNTCFIHPDKGSFFLLGEILSTWNPGIENTPQVESSHKPRTVEGGCGTCRRCQVHCPTGALDKDYMIDARKCLSYLTIENRGLIPEEYWPWIGQYMYGCDICQLVCPYNRGVSVSEEAKSMAQVDPGLDLFSVATMDQVFYEKTFGGTPMTRAKRHGLRRNALIAMYVRSHNRLSEALDLSARDESLVVSGTVEQIRKQIKNKP